MRRTRTTELTAGVLVLFASACVGSSPPVDPAKLVIRASPAPLPGLTGLKLRYKAVQIVASTNLDERPAVIDLGADPGTFDLVAFPKMLPDYVGTFEINPGYIYQIRFLVESLEGRIGPTVVYGKFPSGAETGLKANPSSGGPVKVENHTTVEVTVLFDPADSVTVTPDASGNSPGLTVKPVTTFAVGDVSRDVIDAPLPGELAVTFKDTAEFCDGGGTCSSQPVTRQRVEALNGRVSATVLGNSP